MCGEGLGGEEGVARDWVGKRVWRGTGRGRGCGEGLGGEEGVARDWVGKRVWRGTGWDL